MTAPRGPTPTSAAPRRASRRDAGGLARRDRGRADPRAGRPRHRRGGRGRRDEGRRSRNAAQAGRPAAPPRSAGRRRGHHRGDDQRCRAGLAERDARRHAVGGSRRSSIPSAPSRWRPRSRRGSAAGRARGAGHGRHRDRRPRAGCDQHGDHGGPQRGWAVPAPPGAGVPGGEAGRDAARHARGPVHAADERSERPLDDRGRPAAAGVHVRRLVTARDVSGRAVGVAAGRSGPGARPARRWSRRPRRSRVRRGRRLPARARPSRRSPRSPPSRRRRARRAARTRPPRPRRPVDDQPASEGGASLPASDGAQGGVTSTDTTASGSAGTSIDATGTATAS